MQVRSLEENFKFGNFFSPMLTESDFDAKPSVLLLGQYSTGASQHGASRISSLRASTPHIHCLQRHTVAVVC